MFLGVETCSRSESSIHLARSLDLKIQSRYSQQLESAERVNCLLINDEKAISICI